MPHELPNDLRLRNLRKIRKVQNNVKTSWNYAFMHSPPPFVNISKRLLKNRNWTFPVVCYITWKLEFFSNVLSVVIVSYSIIAANIYETKKRNQAKSDKTRKLWYLLLRKFWPLLLKIYFWKGDWALGSATTQFWDFSIIS